MSKPQILLADNAESVAKTYAEYLELHGYQVKMVSTLDESQRLLEEGRTHLAILDLRMQNDEDEKDISGLTLARASNPLIPKIILTAFPTWEMVRESLRLDEHELPPAVDFASKLDGLQDLLRRVRGAFDKHVRVNWELAIDWKARDRFSLVKLIEPELADEFLPYHAEELEDLLRRLCVRSEQIKIDKLLWHRGRRLALKVFSFAKDKAPEAMLVVCGRNAEVKEEARRYRDYAPKSPKANATTLHLTAETTHFAANAYALAGCSFEDVLSLYELYREDSGRSFTTSLNILFDQTLADWRQEKRVLAESQTLNDLYRTKLGLTSTQVDRQTLAAQVLSLLRLIPMLGLKMEQQGNDLLLRIHGSTFKYPDPVLVAYQTTDIGQPALLVNSPGLLLGDNIVVDPNHQVWLADFAEAGLVPMLWNYVTLEAAVRFDWVETSDPSHLHALEQCLNEENFSRFKPGDFEPAIRKPLRAIQEIRRLGIREAGEDLLPYHLGIFYHAISRLAQSTVTTQLTKNELARLAHLLLSAAMIARLVTQNKAIALPPSLAASGLRLDEASGGAFVEGSYVRLTEQGFKLLRFLEARANQICTRREIIEQVFGYSFDEKDESQEALVNTAISRLRAEVEPDPQHPRFIRNERGRGYRLLTEPSALPER